VNFIAILDDELVAHAEKCRSDTIARQNFALLCAFMRTQALRRAVMRADPRKSPGFPTRFALMIE
jgi:hypothetical protein